MVTGESELTMCAGLQRALLPLERDRKEILEGTKSPILIDIDNGSSYDRVLLMEKIGEGGFGKVYRGELKADRSVNYAVKCLCVKNQQSAIANEVAMHRFVCDRVAELVETNPDLECPIVQFKGCTEERIDDNHYHFYIATEYCPDGDLCSTIMKKDYEPTEDYIKKVFLQICDAVELCHSINVYHRDLKPDNIFCKDGGTKVLLGDFGFATKQRKQKHFNIGSVPYMSPELRAREEFCAAKADVWALGVIFIAMLTRTLPWDESLISDYDYAFYKHCDPNHLLSRFDISTELNDVLKRVFCDAEIRMNVSELRDEIEKITTFGPGNHLVYDVDLELLQKKIEKKFGPRRTLLLPFQLDLLHKDANTILWAFPSKLEQIPSNLATMNDRAADVRQCADLRLTELIAMDPCRRNNRCQYRAGRIVEILDLIENRFNEIREFQTQRIVPPQLPTSLSSTALKIVSNILGTSPSLARSPKPSSRDLIDSYPIVLAPSIVSSEPSFASPIPAGMLGPKPYTKSGSSGEDSSGPITPDMTTTDVNAAVLPTLPPPGGAFDFSKVEAEAVARMRDLALSETIKPSSKTITLQFPKPPAATFAPKVLPEHNTAVPVARLPSLRKPSPPFTKQSPAIGYWLIGGTVAPRKKAPAGWTEKSKLKTEVKPPEKRVEPSKLRMEVKPPEKPKPKPPPPKRSPTSSQRIFQAAVRFLANPKPRKVAA